MVIFSFPNRIVLHFCHILLIYILKSKQIIFSEFSKKKSPLRSWLYVIYWLANDSVYVAHIQIALIQLEYFRRLFPVLCGGFGNEGIFSCFVLSAQSRICDFEMFVHDFVSSDNGPLLFWFINLDHALFLRSPSLQKPPISKSVRKSS